MRWVVELPAGTGGTAATVTVDGESWKSALAAARNGKALPKYRCDFEDDGTVRVHDTHSNERFVLRPLKAVAGARPGASKAQAEGPSPIEEAARRADEAARSERGGAEAAPPATNPVAPVASPVRAGPPPRPSMSDVTVPPPATLLFQRYRDPGASDGLTYRERVLAVPSGTPQSEAERVARETWQLLRAQLQGAPRGQFITIAVFDHAFRSRPERPPLVVVTWKDWRGEAPELSTPSRTPASEAPVAAVAVAVAASDLELPTVPSAPPVDVSPPVVPAPVPAAPVPQVSTVAAAAAPVQAPPVVRAPTAPPPAAPVAMPAAASSLPPISLASNAVAPATVAVAPVVPTPTAATPVSVATPAAAASVVEPPAPAVAPVPPPQPASAVVVPPPPSVSAVVVPPPSAPVAPPPAVPVEPAPSPTASASAPVAPSEPAVDPSVKFPAPSALLPAVQPAVVVARPPSALSPSPPVAEATSSIIIDASLAPSPLAPALTAPPASAVVAPAAPPTVATPAVAPAPAPKAPSVSPPAAAARADVAAPRVPSNVPPTPAANIARTPSAAPAPSRRRGDELLTDAFEATQDLAFLHEPDEACALIAALAKDLLQAPFVAVSLYDIDRDELSLQTLEGGPGERGLRAKLTQGARRDAAIRNVVVALASASGDDPLVSAAPRGAVLYAPANHNGRLFAVVQLHREPGAPAFDTDEQHTASYIAVQLAKFLAEHSQRVGFGDDAPPARR